MSYSINKRGKSWRVLFRSYDNGVLKWKQIPKEGYPQLGIQTNWTVEEARQHVKTLNAQNAIQKKEQETKIRTIERVKHRKRISSAFLPEAKVSEFENMIHSRYGRKPLGLKAQMTRWNTAMLLIHDLRLQMEQAYFRRNEIWGWFIKRGDSLDYVTKVQNVLNRWGEFLNPHYIKVPTPDVIIRSEIHEAYQNSPGYREGSLPLTPKMLEDNKERLKPQQYNWLYVSIWFGLRPEEIDAKNIRVYYEGKVQVLSVYQSKLVTLKASKRWKHIPVYYPEQRKALELWEDVSRPISKTLGKIFGKGVGLYGGRKGFHQLMTKKHSDDQISSWLGHQSGDTLRKHYTDRTKVRL